MNDIGLILLAAGGSSRLGSAKQLLKFRGCSLIRHSCNTALSSICHPCVAVLGANAARMRSEISDLPIETIENSHWRQGIGTSLQTGLSYLELCTEKLEAAIVMLCDQPLVTTQLLNDLALEYAKRACPIVATEYLETVGVPALFRRDLWPEMDRLDPHCGAKSMILLHLNNIGKVPFFDAGVDIDTPMDWERLKTQDKFRWESKTAVD